MAPNQEQIRLGRPMFDRQKRHLITLRAHNQLARLLFLLGMLPLEVPLGLLKRREFPRTKRARKVLEMNMGFIGVGGEGIAAGGDEGAAGFRASEARGRDLNEIKVGSH